MFTNPLMRLYAILPLNKLLVLLVLCYVNGELSSQVASMHCPYDTISPYPDSVYNADPCIDVQEILDELDGGDACRQIWINLNVHFFVHTSHLNNLITPSGHTVSEANSIAEELINDANYHLYLNETQLNQSGAIKLCNPFQYVLKGVYIHETSNSNPNAVGNLGTWMTTWGVNASSEFNLFISPCYDSGRPCSGVAQDIGGTTIAFNLFGLDGQILNHEWGHTMGLNHSWTSDNISDTPPISFNLDRNCSGGTPSGLYEVAQQCWGLVDDDPSEVGPGNDAIGTSFSNGRYYNGVNDCNENQNPTPPTIPCPISPCCDPAYLNNNVMAYNSCQCSFTYLQLKKVLENILSYKCDYINSMHTDRDCWAPSAFISYPKPGKSDYGYCSTEFDFSASYNDSRYKVKIYEITGGGPVLRYESTWLTGPATKISFKNYGISVGTGRYLKPSTNYRIELIVEFINVECAEDPAPSASYNRNFTTGACAPDPYDPPMTFGSMIMAPNPASTDITLTFDAFEGEEFSIFAVNQGNAQLSLLCNSLYATNEGENEYEVSVNSLGNGTYTIFLIGIENNYYETLVKQ